MAAEEAGTWGAGVFRRHRGLPPRALLAILAFSTVAAIPDPFTWPARVATAVPILAVLVLAVRRDWHRPHLPVTQTRPTGAVGIAAAAVWAVLIVAAVAVQMFNFTAEPREIYPTLSSLAAGFLSLYPARVVAFAAWIWLGWYFVDR